MKAYKPMGYFLLITLTSLLLVSCGSTAPSKLSRKDINGIWEWTRKNSEDQIGFDDYLYFEDDYFLNSYNSLDDIQTLNDFAKQAKSQNKEFADTTIPEIIKEMKKMAPLKGLKLMDYEEYIKFYEQLEKETDWDRDIDSLKSLEQVINLFKNQGYTVTENDIYCVGNDVSFALLENGSKLGIFSFENRWSSKENLRIEVFTKYIPENHK